MNVALRGTSQETLKRLFSKYHIIYISDRETDKLPKLISDVVLKKYKEMNDVGCNKKVTRLKQLEIFYSLKL